MSKVYCFAFVYDEDGMIDISTMDATPELVKERLLNVSMGWRYDAETQKKEWDRIGQLGKIVRVVIEPAERESGHGN